MTIKITQPGEREDVLVGNPVNFEGAVNGNIVKVELFADGRWSLGHVDVTSENWSITYPKFNRAGTRNIVARGFDSHGDVVAIDDIWLDVNPAIIDPNIKLTENFTLREFVISATADRLRIDNTPNEQEIENLRTLCTTILQPAHDALGPLKISSGFRSEALNQAVGGAPNSDHRLGFAADVYPIDAGTRELAKWVVHNVPKFDQVILEFGTLEYPNWIHISANSRCRREILRAFSSRGQTQYVAISL